MTHSHANRNKHRLNTVPEGVAGLDKVDQLAIAHMALEMAVRALQADVKALKQENKELHERLHCVEERVDCKPKLNKGMEEYDTAVEGENEHGATETPDVHREAQELPAG